MLERLEAVKNLFIDNALEVTLEESGSEGRRRAGLYRFPLFLLLFANRLKQTVIDLFTEG